MKDVPAVSDAGSDSSSLAKRVCNFVDSIMTCKKDWDDNPHHINPSLSNAGTWDEILKRQYHKHTRLVENEMG